MTNNNSLELLEKYFDTAIASPDGIKRLRELILSLAMQGKLVPQYPTDQPASELLKEIEAEKGRLIKEGKIKKSKSLGNIKVDEIPYEIPKNWQWVRLNEITEYNGRINVNSQDILPDTWLLDLEDIEKDTSRIIYRAKYSERQSKSTKSTFLKGDVLYGKLRPYLNKIVVADNNGVCTTEIVPIIPYKGIDSYFLKWLLKRPKFLQYVNSLMYGVKMPRLGTNDAIQSIHPLPPTNEQYRIVKKIDFLMAQCDELEKLRAEHDKKRLIVHSAARDRLLNPNDDQSSKEAWDFIRNNFSDLYSVKENVKELRKAILQLAVMGKLVLQNPNDPPASELLKEIEDKKIRKFSEIRSDEIPYKIPQKWKWVRLGTVGKFERGKSKHRPRNDRKLFVDGTYPFIQTGDVARAKKTKDQITTYSGCYNDVGLAQSRLWSKGTLCITIAANIAETGFLNFEACVPDSVVTFQSLNDAISKFVKIFIDVAKDDLENYAPATAQKNINLGIINELVFPLPPLIEQHRIVAKVDQLMTLCDRLEQQIDQSTNKQTDLLNAVIAKI